MSLFLRHWRKSVRLTRYHALLLRAFATTMLILVFPATAAATAPVFLVPLDRPLDGTGFTFSCSTAGGKKETAAVAPHALTAAGGEKNAKPAPVPVPEAAWFLGLGLIGLCALVWCIPSSQARGADKSGKIGEDKCHFARDESCAPGVAQPRGE